MDASAPGSRGAFPTRDRACRRGGVPRAGRTVSSTGAVPSMDNVLWLTSLGPLSTGWDARAAVVLHKVMLTGEWLLCNTLNINVVSTSKLGQSITCLPLSSDDAEWPKVADAVTESLHPLRSLQETHTMGVGTLV